MTFLLGIDTGGTFTDAALLETGADGSTDHARVVAKAKALTSRHDLSIGIAQAIKAVVETSACAPSEIGLVSLSTTLATNALVEGQGGRVALISIGFDERDLTKAGLADALGTGPKILLQGGHTTHGSQAAPLDLAPLVAEIEDLSKSVSGFAVAGYFAVRNPAHEIAVRDYIVKRTGMPVTCSHELSAKLNGPKRALTTVLNARLVPMITRLIEATGKALQDAGIQASLMVVRGDGALVSAEFATGRPIETILSGPAASLVGARHLTGADKAFVNDIGGTTSDIALLEDGRPLLDPDGAMVGGFRTMVEAVAMHTFGLGGDSQVSLGGTALKPQLILGPRRFVPVSLIAVQHNAVVHAALDGQLKSTLNNRFDGRFAFRSGAGITTGLSAAEIRLWDKITDVPQLLTKILDSTLQAASLDKLVARGLVQIAGLTPSDAMSALGRQTIWDREAAHKTLQLFARQRDGSGKPLRADPLDLARWIVQSVERRSAEVVLETALAVDGIDPSLAYRDLLPTVLDRREIEHDDKVAASNLVQTAFKLDRPLIGLGASAHAYHGPAAYLLGVEAIIPEHADVANAIGAVVGQISMQVSVFISQPTEGRFQVSGLEEAFASEEDAVAAANDSANTRVQELARKAGANEVIISLERNDNRATIENRDVLVDATIIARAAGRPPIVSAGGPA